MQALVQQISDDLIAYLRQTLSRPEIEYAEPPDPLSGGYETLILTFTLTNAPPAYSCPLILRLLQSFSPPRRALREATVQNGVSALGIPVPRVLAYSGAPLIVGRAFVIMERIAGSSMLQLLGKLSPYGIRLLTEMGKLQVRINQVPVDALHLRLRSNKVRLKTLPDTVRMMEEKIRQHGFDQLMEGMEWVKANRLDDSCSPCLCHGDFHPGNLMVREGRIVAIIDWANAIIGDKEWDIAKTLLVLQAGPFIQINKPVDALVGLGRRLVADRYLRTYNKHLKVDYERLDYYRILHAFNAIITATYVTKLSLEGRLDKHHQETAWRQARIYATLTGIFEKGTGISLQ